jgi:hypothetical protein
MPIWFGVLLVVALWLTARPYVGLRHDGILYVGQALLHLRPATMSKDLFFAYGSQDEFSVMSTLLVGLYSRWGIAGVQMAVPLLSESAILVTGYFLLRSFAPMERWLGLCALAVLSHIYGGDGIFAFAERFVTGRTLAEPLALTALAVVIYGRPFLACAILLIAAAIHPLVALPVIVVGWLYLCLGDRRWAWAGAAILIPLGLGWWGMKPFAALWERYDTSWWDAVTGTNAQVLLSTWKSADWQVVVLDLTVLVGAARLFAMPLGRLAWAMALGSVGLLIVSAVGADLIHDVLITQLQTWRVLWLAHLFSLLLLPAVVMAVWRWGGLGPLTALALAATVVAVNGRWESGWVFVGWTAIALVLTRFECKISVHVRRAAMIATGAALLALSTAVSARNAALFAASQSHLDLPTVVLLASSTPALAMPAAAALLSAWRHGRTRALLATALVAVAALYGVITWDRRSPWTRYVEEALPREHPFEKLIPRGAQVYWHEDLASTWVVLKRPSYFSAAQGAGLLFNRRTAMEYQRRARAFAPLRLQGEVCRIMSALGGEAYDPTTCVPSAGLMQALCQTPDGPDFLIFERHLSEGLVAQWSFNAEGQAPRTYYLYDCVKLR